MQQSHVANLLMASVGSKEEQQQQYRRRKKISRDLRRVLPPLPALVSNWWSVEFAIPYVSAYILVLVFFGAFINWPSFVILLNVSTFTCRHKVGWDGCWKRELVGWNDRGGSCFQEAGTQRVWGLISTKPGPSRLDPTPFLSPQACGWGSWL